MYHWTDYIKNCLFVLMIVLVSCNRDNDNVIEDGIYVPLQIGDVSSDGIAFKGVSTRLETALSTGDIGVFRLESTEYTETRSNVKYTYSGSVWDVASGTDPIYLTQNEANICAYYPYSSDDDYTDGNITLTSQVYSEGADLCYQTNVNANSGTKKVSFTMGHCYAKLTLTFTHIASYTGYCFVKDISIENDGILTSNTLDITSGSYGTGTKGNVTVPDIGCISSGTSAVVTVLMVPVSTLSGDITLSFNVDGQKVTKLHNITSLEAGSTHDIKVDIQ